jgi:hypothetical protein
LKTHEGRVQMSEVAGLKTPDTHGVTTATPYRLGSRNPSLDSGVYLREFAWVLAALSASRHRIILLRIPNLTFS